MTLRGKYGRYTLPFEAGILIRSRVLRELRKYLDQCGLTYRIHNYPGLLASDYLLEVALDTANQLSLIKSLERQLEEWNEEEPG